MDTIKLFNCDVLYFQEKVIKPGVAMMKLFTYIFMKILFTPDITIMNHFNNNAFNFSNNQSFSFIDQFKSRYF